MRQLVFRRRGGVLDGVLIDALGNDFRDPNQTRATTMVARCIFENPQAPDARERLAAMIAKAQERAKPRVATRPTRASRTRRLDEKARRGAVKAFRGRATEAE